MDCAAFRVEFVWIDVSRMHTTDVEWSGESSGNGGMRRLIQLRKLLNRFRHFGLAVALSMVHSTYGNYKNRIELSEKNKTSVGKSAVREGGKLLIGFCFRYVNLQCFT